MNREQYSNCLIKFTEIVKKRFNNLTTEETVRFVISLLDVVIEETKDDE